MNEKEYTAFEMIEAILRDNTKVFISDDDVSSKVQFDTENDEIIWSGSGNVFQCNYSTIYDYRWIEDVKTVKFEDWEVGKVYNRVGRKNPVNYTLILGKICMLNLEGDWIESCYDFDDAREIDWVESDYKY